MLPETAQSQSMIWPPRSWAPVFETLREWSAWYSGDTNCLADFYRTEATKPAQRSWWKFWAKHRAGSREHQRQLHVPLAGDIAATSASLLFSEEPTIHIPEAHDTLSASPNASALEVEDRLREIWDYSNMHSTLLEAADTGAALGGVYLRVCWDKERYDYPFLSQVDADAAVPTFGYGQLQAVTFWQVLEDDKAPTPSASKVMRHLERYEPGFIFNGVYLGSADKLGERISLNAHPRTANLEEEVVLPDAQMLAVRYIPNVRPARKFRTMGYAARLGQSDFAGSEGLLDAFDEVWTSWMRDIRLGRSRIIVPEEWLRAEKAGPNSEDTILKFDTDQEVFVGMNVPPEQNQSAGITENQFTIRYQEHSATSLDLLDRIVTSAGYSPQTFGIRIEGRAESGTALQLRERKTFLTQQKKRGYWEQPMGELMGILLAIDAWMFGGAKAEFYPRFKMADSITPSSDEIATTVELINRAQAASVEVRVRTLHPDWSKEEVDLEVTRLRDELGMNVPDPSQLGSGLNSNLDAQGNIVDPTLDANGQPLQPAKNGATVHA